MKKNILFAWAMAGILCLNACKDEANLPGNPAIDLRTEHVDAFFGDSLPFTVKASDVDVPLSTLKAQLYFGDEKVSETVIRTKTSGEDYTGKIYVPFLPGIPNGKATLKYVLQNIHFTTSEIETEVALERPDYPYLTLVGANGTEYRMERVGLYQYSVTQKFPQEMKGYIRTPKAGPFSNELTFGWEGSGIALGLTTPITFSSPGTGAYPITFNIFSYEASPFVKLLVDGEQMEIVDSESYRINLTLTKGQLLEFDGVPDFDNWWIDPDFFKKESDGRLQFLPLGGDYRIVANMKLKCFFVQALKDGALATLQPDGTGAVWLIGNGVGKPSLATREVGWNTGNGLCLSQMEPKKYQITLVAGRSVKATGIDFKFFYQQDWGGEFKGAALTSTSDLVGVGTGKVDGVGHDDGNLYLKEGKSLTPGHIYKFVVDLTKGIGSSVLTVTDEGEQPVEVRNITFAGVKMASVDGEIYTSVLPLQQNQALSVMGIETLDEWWVDPDYFSWAEGEMSFIPVSGDYRVTINLPAQILSAVRMNGAEEATLSDDGHGAIWLMGWGVGSPSLENQFGWTPGAAYCLPEVAPKVYRFTCTAGPEKGSLPGQRIRFDYLSCKFFYQNGWGQEFSKGQNRALTIAPGSEAYIVDNGNIEFAGGVALTEGATYVMTVDLTAGNDKGVLSFAKK